MKLSRCSRCGAAAVIGLYGAGARERLCSVHKNELETQAILAAEASAAQQAFPPDQRSAWIPCGRHEVLVQLYHPGVRAERARVAPHLREVRLPEPARRPGWRMKNRKAGAKRRAGRNGHRA